MTEHATTLYYSALGESNTKEGWLRFMLDSYKEMGIAIPNNHSWEKTQKLLQLTDYDPTVIKKQYVSSYGDILFNRSKTFTEPLERIDIDRPKHKPSEKKKGFKGIALDIATRNGIRDALEQKELTIQQIADKFDVTKMTVYNVRNEPKSIEERDKLILHELEEEKKTIGQVAQEYGISRRRVEQIRAHHGITYNKIRKTLSDSKKKEIITLNQQGLSCKEIMDKLDISKSTFYNTLKLNKYLLKCV